MLRLFYLFTTASVIRGQARTIEKKNIKMFRRSVIPMSKYDCTSRECRVKKDLTYHSINNKDTERQKQIILQIKVQDDEALSILGKMNQLCTIKASLFILLRHSRKNIPTIQNQTLENTFLLSLLNNLIFLAAGSVKSLSLTRPKGSSP